MPIEPIYVPLHIPTAWACHLVAAILLNELLQTLIALLDQRFAQCLCKLLSGFLNVALLLSLRVGCNGLFALAQGVLFFIAEPTGHLAAATLPALANKQRLLARRRQNALELAERALGHVLDLQAVYGLLRDEDVPSLNEFRVEQGGDVLLRQHGSTIEASAFDDSPL